MTTEPADLYPYRHSMSSYPAHAVADRLPELLAFNQPVQVTHNDHAPWVLVPGDWYDTMLSAQVCTDFHIEQRRQHHEPLPRP